MTQPDLPKEANTVEKIITGGYSSLQIKQHTTLKTRPLHMVF